MQPVKRGKEKKTPRPRGSKRTCIPITAGMSCIVWNTGTGPAWAEKRDDDVVVRELIAAPSW